MKHCLRFVLPRSLYQLKVDIFISLVLYIYMYIYLKCVIDTSECYDIRRDFTLLYDSHYFFVYACE
jgi:hypothetical protein